MMNDLILWRHAEAEPGEPDMERKLTPKGHKQAAKMAAWLDRQLPANCRILCSPAERTLQTVKPLDRKYRICEALAPDLEARKALEACGQSDRGEPVLIVGHQPMLGQIASLLLAGVEQPWSIRKGSIVWIAKHKLREEEDTASFYIKAALPPEMTGK